MAPPILVLASTSPRRANVLRQLGLQFEVDVSDVDETLPKGLTVDSGVLEVARAKLETVRTRRNRPGEFYLAADTVVVLGDRVIGKPSGPADAVAILKSLAGRSHRVVSGLLLRDAMGRVHEATESSEVRLAPLSAEQIQSYVATGEPLDKAGAYAVQGQGASFILDVRGDYTNVIGLPVRTTLRLLAAGGYPLPAHLRPS